MTGKSAEKDAEELERIAIETLRGLEDKSHEEILKELDIFSLQKRKLRVIHDSNFHFLKGCQREENMDLFSSGCRGSITGGFQIKIGQSFIWRGQRIPTLGMTLE